MLRMPFKAYQMIEYINTITISNILQNLIKNGLAKKLSEF